MPVKCKLDLRNSVVNRELAQMKLNVLKNMWRQVTCYIHWVHWPLSWLWVSLIVRYIGLVRQQDQGKCFGDRLFIKWKCWHTSWPETSIASVV